MNIWWKQKSGCKSYTFVLTIMCHSKCAIKNKHEVIILFQSGMPVFTCMLIENKCQTTTELQYAARESAHAARELVYTPLKQKRYAISHFTISALVVIS